MRMIYLHMRFHMSYSMKLTAESVHFSGCIHEYSTLQFFSWYMCASLVCVCCTAILVRSRTKVLNSCLGCAAKVQVVQQMPVDCDKV